MAKDSFEGFDHTQYKDEVIERWGKDAYEKGDKWWISLSKEQKERFQQDQLDIARDFAKAKAEGESPDGPVAQGIAGRQYRWVAIGWQGREPTAEEYEGLGQMYVDDSRFRSNYDRHGAGTAEFIRDSMSVYAKRHLE